MTLDVLRQHQLFANRSKCKFGSFEVAYFRHIIFAQGVKANPNKLTSLKALRGFFGLIEDYRRFINGYGGIVAPTYRNAEKDEFIWSEESREAFQKLKEAIMQALVLALPDFSILFTIGCDTSGTLIGSALKQRGHPLAFFSQVLKGRAQVMST
ncbi:hypothetical protein F2P56_015375 [Juglans regia]|uniref:Uncharacterized mitochondrial protein AtMg00860-like n=2 Tax=Juglans regia TaxID=51240 RepID=A0A2I4DEM9_JUGRE|nr:uncharacterized mitochondrial protein AtMg00860-like [Juglans regia]KAF5465359.1 hypothetical protein F2P56_015375 [Juglans regia]